MIRKASLKRYSTVVEEILKFNSNLIKDFTLHASSNLSRPQKSPIFRFE